MDILNKEYTIECNGCYKIINLIKGKEIGRIADDYEESELGIYCEDCYKRAHNNKCQLCNNVKCGNHFNVIFYNKVLCYYCLPRNKEEEENIKTI